MLFKNEFTNIIYVSDPILLWNMSTPALPLSTNCPSYLNIVGGYRTFYESHYILKTYYLPTHSAIKLVFTLYLLDKWSGDSMEVFFDSGSVFKVNYISSGKTNICGDTYADMIQNITLQENHSSSTLNLQLQSHISLLNDDGFTQSWGVRDLLLYVDVPCPYLCKGCSVSGNFCYNQVFFSEQNSTTLVISCKDGFFEDFNENRCNICHYSCLTCNAAGPYNCSSCFEFDLLDSNLNSCNHSSIFR